MDIGYFLFGGGHTEMLGEIPYNLSRSRKVVWMSGRWIHYRLGSESDMHI